jgi:hypothetical protein
LCGKVASDFADQPSAYLSKSSGCFLTLTKRMGFSSTLITPRPIIMLHNRSPLSDMALQGDYPMQFKRFVAGTCVLFAASVAMAQSANPVSYNRIIAEYSKDAKAAAAKYDKKRLVFKGQLISMGSEPESTYFGAVAEDGALFDTSFEVADQASLAEKFPGGQIEAFATSSSLVFECLNEGLVGAISPGLKLTHCRVLR